MNVYSHVCSPVVLDTASKHQDIFKHSTILPALQPSHNTNEMQRTWYHIFPIWIVTWGREKQKSLLLTLQGETDQGHWATCTFFLLECKGYGGGINQMEAQNIPYCLNYSWAALLLPTKFR